MNESLSITLRNYWNNGIETVWTIYVPLIILGVFILFCLLVSHFRGKSKKTVTVKSLSSIYLAGIITTFLIILTVLGLMKFSLFLTANICQIGFLIGLLFVASFTIIAYKKLCKLGRFKDSNALGLSITNSELRIKTQELRRYTLTLWLWSLLLATPFAILSIPNKSKHLVSIVLDNSGSMNQNFIQCTNALGAALLHTKKYADYVFTTIDYTKNNELIEKAIADTNKDNKTLFQFTNKYFDDIIAQKSSGKLSTNTEIYNDAISLYNAFSQIGIAESGSPVYEGIWQNYLMSKELCKNTAYNSKKLIVITDGADNLYYYLNNDNIQRPNQKLLHRDIFQQKGSNGESASDLFNSICFINYGENDDLMFADCGNSINEILDGTDEQSYFDAFRSILPEMFFDNLLLYILILFSILFSLVLLIIKSFTL